MRYQDQVRQTARETPWRGVKSTPRGPNLEPAGKGALVLASGLLPSPFLATHRSLLPSTMFEAKCRQTSASNGGRTRETASLLLRHSSPCIFTLHLSPPSHRPFQRDSLHSSGFRRGRKNGPRQPGYDDTAAAVRRITLPAGAGLLEFPSWAAVCQATRPSFNL
jgi:hypothetical protein